ncbi:MAG: prepilin-type N-terminal cleavage/methylation domain-containing protein [Nitrospira sp.]|nr:prepilin-type N-terminal cleavage/methylation domain-containing protein [Nitrospira sp.]MCA9465272.1 prepilin-type N-terminal cleavage/methylation domain-containing protein [Nitrospira sp.]MCA9476045.1 prepilin-type N-terminal cleavage/methylation domain-containing protein [Nitrospira sp.]MCA9481962.1 prepilin-type N-terminal cleavage/methylation domain-containing protein [Nitrospira sp.]MCB9712196.1 prepilin-type N-terminal cleavage/methylation domain-containing protein [Nitrospiraceae bact
MRHFAVMHKKGYTLLELMIVVAIVGILVTLAIPTFQQSAMKAKEAALKQNLFTMRAVIDQYYADRGDYPSSLDALVEAKYLREIPVDPLTKSNSTWTTIYEDQEEGDDSPAGIYDVKSGSDEAALDGTPYKEW